MDVKLRNTRVVAVDGGTATGKGRLIDELAGYLRLKGVAVIHASTGSLYRAVAYVAFEYAAQMVIAKAHMSKGQIVHAALEIVREMSGENLLALARDRQIQMHNGQVWIDSVLASLDDQLKGPGIGIGASIVSEVLDVRQFVNEITRRQINEFDGFALIDGRDISHTVVPDAPLKLLLTVTPKVAAKRSSEHTLAQIIARDQKDKAKKYGALKNPDDPGEGVIVLATDKHTPESLRDHVYNLMRGTFAELPEA